MKSTTILLALALVFVFGCTNSQSGKDVKHLEKRLQNGDIIFQSSQSGQSKAIQLATHSKYSHVGIIYEQDGQLYV